jgi:methylthioribulose-1-phosphate dehydratase
MFFNLPSNRFARRLAGATVAAGFRLPAATSASARAGACWSQPAAWTRARSRPSGLIEVDLDGYVLAGTGKPSAETGLHLVLYRYRPTAGAILHVHTIWNTLLSSHYEARGCVPIEGYELLKGLAGVTTHAYLEQVPILENSQDYAELSDRLAEALGKYPRAHGVLLSRHGLYTWGESVAEARRHLEALEFLFEVEGRRLLGGQL